MPLQAKVPATESRVERSTADSVNRRIHKELEAFVSYYAHHPGEIDGRLRELDQEWDVERVLEANAAVIAMAGAGLGLIRRKWCLLPILVGGFLLQHAVQGWCPPVPAFRRMGIRTTREINHERFALKALRGDFDAVRADDGQDREGRGLRAIEAADPYR
jgi:hypothetical protein